MHAPFLDRDLRVIPIDAYIDPPQPRARAIITHGHADHARSGHGAVLATPDTIAIMKVRYGEDCAERFQPLDLGTPLQVDDVTHHAPSRRPYPRLGAGGDGASRSGRTWSPATTSACRTARRSRSSWSSATCWSPRRRSGCRCSSTPNRSTRSPGCSLGRGLPGALPCHRLLRAGQGAAGDRAVARCRL